ncbi:MAG: N-acetylneuraminate synthase family protein [Gemmatimonadaceae bacterium]|nr:N-acetylneuraminate synthase family protein [Gemmatimonadaceae bacterium]
MGEGHLPYVIAEIGANHNGDMALAREMISAAKDCGCDAVKFQLWGRHTAHTESYIKKLSAQKKLGDVDLATPELGLGTVADQLEKFQCTQDQHVELKQYADGLGIDFSSTALTEEDIDFLAELDVAFLKIASQDTDHPYFIRYIAEKEMPTILSTGLSNWAEIEEAVECFRPDYMHNLCLMHVVSLYPPEDRLINLRKMDSMRQLFGVPVGYSDHSIGFSVPLAAVTLGAAAIEKHFTLDKNMPGWDHKVSADPSEMRIICSEARRIHAALGSPNPLLSPDEVKKADHFRRSIITTTLIRKGDTITLDKLFFKRPGIGIKPNELRYVVNRVAKRDIEADELVNWDDLV